MPRPGPTYEEIHERFTYHVPTPEQRERLDRLAAGLHTFLDVVLDVLPEHTQDRAVALTQLSLGRMLLNAAIISSPAAEGGA
jgi:hypothetical protein